MGPIFSIIVPFYNDSDVIESCIQSIENQDMSDYEVLIVNDGSLNDELERLELLIQNSRISGKIAVHTQLNAGPAAARNTGIKNAKGLYLCFCDADDQFEPNRLSEAYGVFKSNPELFVMFNAYTIQNESGMQTRLDRSPVFREKKSILRAIVRGEVRSHISTISFRRGEDPFYFSERLKYFEDWDFVARIIEPGPYLYFNKPLCIKQDRKDGYSRQNRIKRLPIILSSRLLLNYGILTRQQLNIFDLLYQNVLGLLRILGLRRTT